MRTTLQILEQELERLELESSLNPYIVFTGVDQRSFLECFEDSEESLLTKSWDTYDHSSQQIIIKMPSTNHEIAASAFSQIFFLWARQVRDNPLVATNRATVRGSTRSKEADISWRPLLPPTGRSNKWPTLAVEISWSEQRLKFEQDVDFWLSESNGDVKVALTISVHARGRITIESWELASAPAGGVSKPHPTQRIEIVRNPAPNCSPIEGQLTLPFQDIFLRDKQKDETDFTLTHNDMEDIATVVWATQFP